MIIYIMGDLTPPHSTIFHGLATDINDPNPYKHQSQEQREIIYNNLVATLKDVIKACDSPDQRELFFLPEHFMNIQNQMSVNKLPSYSVDFFLFDKNNNDSPILFGKLDSIRMVIHTNYLLVLVNNKPEKYEISTESYYIAQTTAVINRLLNINNYIASIFFIGALYSQDGLTQFREYIRRRFKKNKFDAILSHEIGGKRRKRSKSAIKKLKRKKQKTQKKRRK